MLKHSPARLSLVLAIMTITTVVTVSALAAVPTFWRLESQTDFLAGNTDGISVSSDGTIGLAPSAQVLTEATDPHFWALAVDGSGNVYIGSGNDGKIYKIDSAGESSVVMDADELQVHALAVDRRGTLYAGTSPRGVVYRIAPEVGTHEVFFDPDDRYIWALAVDSLNNVIVATGDEAKIYRVTSSGESEVLFTSEETHIVSLAIGGDDTIYAGTESNGLVLKIDGDGVTSVLFDTPFQEVAAITTDTRGNVFVAAIQASTQASRAPSPSVTPQPTSTATPTGGTATVTVTATPVVAQSSSPNLASSSARGSIYRIAPDGAAEELWTTHEDTPLSLSLVRDDRLMVGTGKEGRVFLVGQNQTSSLLLSVDADQVTAIQITAGGQTFLATSNPAKLYRLNPGRRTEGVYQSPTRDTETVSSWGKIRWEARAPSGTSVRLQTRSGNSAEPDNTWSEWSQSYTGADGEQIRSPRGRFFQWRAVLSSTGETTPELFNVTAVYLQQNLPPEVSDITIHPPGRSFQKPIVTTGQIEILGLDGALSDGTETGNGGNQGQPATPPMDITAMSRPMYRKGLQTVTWKSTDPNHDELAFDVHYRAQGETLWRVLREGLKSPVIAWDTVAMPDGRYSLRIVASDAPGNPADTARTGERTSKSFEVDNTPPRVENLTISPGSNGHQVTFTARDDMSPVRSVEYAVNSGAWNVIFPVDGIADSKEERFEFHLEGYDDGGVYTLVIKLTDGLENTATARAELR